MKIVYLDPVGGIAGDMALGALVDAGVPLVEITRPLESLGLGGYEISSERTMRGFIDAVKVNVSLTREDHAHRQSAGVSSMTSRYLSDIAAIIRKSNIPDRAKERSIKTFELLARAEAKVHGTTIEKVHFHEVGAVDSIVDIVGFALGLEYLGIDKVYTGPLKFGSGTIESAHETIPLPSPAAAECARGLDAVFTSEKGEMTTPTGAAIAAALAESGAHPGDFNITAVGYGAGASEWESVPNVLRIFVGEKTGAAGRAVLLETNIDDVSAEIVGSVFDKVLAAGALDVFAIPATMKKSRPGLVLGVIARESDCKLMEEIIFRESTTFGIRRSTIDRTVLDREAVKIETVYGPLDVKLGRYKGELVTAAPEYESARALSESAGVPLKEIYRAAAAYTTPIEGAKP
jgi:uncharacterized protein (TIGR00299 family) protein